VNLASLRSFNVIVPGLIGFQCWHNHLVQVTDLLHRVSAGDDEALSELLPLVYRELKALAASHLRRERERAGLQTTELVHEAYIRLTAISHPDYERRAQFYGIASRLMRQLLVDLARTRLARKRGNDCTIALACLDCLEMSQPGQPQTDEQLLALNDALDRLATEHPRKAQLIEMRYFGGMTAEESALALQMVVPAVRSELRYAEAWLKRELQA
jgi:RNA polymerase sigma factor (TIGR02999 family)